MLALPLIRIRAPGAAPAAGGPLLAVASAPFARVTSTPPAVQRSAVESDGRATFGRFRLTALRTHRVTATPPCSDSSS